MKGKLVGFLALFGCAGIFTFIYLQHQILVKEVESIERTSTVTRSAAPSSF